MPSDKVMYGIVGIGALYAFSRMGSDTGGGDGNGPGSMSINEIDRDGQAVTLALSAGNTAAIESITWYVQYDDGTAAEAGTGDQTTINFSAQGSYSVLADVTDSSGRSYTVETEVGVGPDMSRF